MTEKVQEPDIDLTQEIFRQSIIPVQEFYKMCVMISYKTANTQSEVERMPYYVFNNFVAYLNEIIEEENKSESKVDTNQDMMQGMFNKQMSAAKSMMNSSPKKFH